MIVSHIFAWGVSIGVAAFLYFLSLSIVFRRIRANRYLRERWEQFGQGIVGKWDGTTHKIQEKRLQSLKKTSRLKSLLAHPYPSFKRIEYLFYRSDVFSNIKTHITMQIFAIALITEALLIFEKIPLGDSLFLGICISVAIHFFILKSRERRSKKAFFKIFPVSLDIITRGLKSGMTLGRGIAMVAEELEDPVGSEFNYMASQLQIGMSPPDSLTEAADRIDIDEFRFFSLALIIQREIGGSLADILGKLSEVIREREHFRKKVRTLSSESRATALIVGSLPIFVAIIVEFISPGYMKFFLTDPKGRIMLWICAGLSLSGFVFITRMMKVEG